MTLKDCILLIRNDRSFALGVLVTAIALIALLFAGNGGKEAESGEDNRDSLKASSDTRAGKGYARSEYSLSDNGKGYYAAEPKEVCLRAFDPNTADSTTLLLLGLTPWQVKNIYRYRAAGGVYTCKEDFARLYGLSVKKYRELEPYIRISPEYRPASEVYHKAYGRPAEQREGQNAAVASRPMTASDSTVARAIAYDEVRKLRKGETIALNLADTTELRSVPGIGRYYARKIARYREQLGGFTSVEQLKEIDDFPLSALPYFSLDNDGGQHIRKININKASTEELRRHPYITPVMARQIRRYIQMKGRIEHLSDLRLLPSFTPETIERLLPYIEY